MFLSGWTCTKPVNTHSRHVPKYMYPLWYLYLYTHFSTRTRVPVPISIWYPKLVDYLYPYLVLVHEPVPRYTTWYPYPYPVLVPNLPHHFQVMPLRRRRRRRRKRRRRRGMEEGRRQLVPVRRTCPPPKMNWEFIQCQWMKGPIFAPSKTSSATSLAPLFPKVYSHHWGGGGWGGGGWEGGSGWLPQSKGLSQKWAESLYSVYGWKAQIFPLKNLLCHLTCPTISEKVTVTPLLKEGEGRMGEGGCSWLPQSERLVPPPHLPQNELGV